MIELRFSDLPIHPQNISQIDEIDRVTFVVAYRIYTLLS